MNTIKSIVKNIIIIAGLSAVTVFAWTGPTAPPPDNNTSAPINVSSTFQSKAGSLWVDGGLGVGWGATIGTYGGNVGIGSASPSNKLEVLKASTPCCGVGSSYGLRVNYGGATYTGLHLGDFGYGNASVIQTFNQPISINPAGNNVGIGIASPASKLHVAGDGQFGASSAGLAGSLEFKTGAGSPISVRQQFGTDGTGWQYRIAKNQAGTVTDLVTVTDAGNVGIGITTPTQKLEVAGNIKASGALEIGIGTAIPGGNMLDIASIKGGVGNSAIRALYPGGAGLLNTEFGALAHRNGVWTAVYGKQGAASSAGYFDGKVGIGIASPTEQLDVVGNVKGTGLCIGSDCRTSWPSGGGGGVSGSGASNTLTNWTGANSIGNYSGAGCPAGQVMSGLNANGTPNCVAQSAGNVTGFGTAGNLTTWSSLTAVTNYSGSNTCLAGTYAAKVNADGTVNCMPSQMPTTQKICISDSTRVFTVPNTWLQVNCQSINAVWQGGRYQVGCIFSNSPYYSVNAGTIWNDPHGPTPNPNCGWD